MLNGVKVWTKCSDFLLQDNLLNVNEDINLTMDAAHINCHNNHLRHYFVTDVTQFDDDVENRIILQSCFTLSKKYTRGMRN